MKYYAVKKGREIGIFNSWSDCEKSVKGYSGAVFKSFTNREDATKYLTQKGTEFVDYNFSEEDIHTMIASTDTVTAFVDGSYDASKKRYSFGLVALGLGTIHEDYCDDFLFLEMKNVAGELMGAMEAMDYCIKNKVKNLNLFYDYEGVAKWALGEWTANKLGTQDYKIFYDSIKDKLNVKFYKVPAHSGITYNERADKLAKKALEIL